MPPNQAFLQALMDLSITALTSSRTEVDETLLAEAADEFLAAWTLLCTSARAEHLWRVRVAKNGVALTAQSVGDQRT